MNTDIENMFGFITCEVTRQTMVNGFWAVTQANLWDWLKDYVTNPATGFTFANDPELMKILDFMEKEGAPYRMSHSGASFGFVMSNMSYIAKNGIEGYKTLYLSKRVSS